MDPSVEYLRHLGYDTKVIHGLKAPGRIKLIAKHFGYRNTPKITLRQARVFLQEYLALETQNHETFGLLFKTHISKHLAKYIRNEALDEHDIVIANLPSDKFYQSPEWRKLRYSVLDKFGNKCMACGRTPYKHGVSIHVDHILPRSIYPEHALTFTNMQILCEDCNMGKSNVFETNWKR